jgi:hypothetical protein
VTEEREDMPMENMKKEKIIQVEIGKLVLQDHPLLMWESSELDLFHKDDILKMLQLGRMLKLELEQPALLRPLPLQKPLLSPKQNLMFVATMVAMM